MTRHAETRYVDDWNVRRDGPTVFLDLYPPGATAADPPACSIALNRIAAENIGRNLQWAGQGVTTPPTPPRPEPVATADLVVEDDVVLYARVRFGSGVWMPQEKYDALATALEAEREVKEMGLREIGRLTAALEARDRRIAEMEAGLRTIAQVPELDHWAGKIASDLLERRAAGGEG